LLFYILLSAQAVVAINIDNLEAEAVVTLLKDNMQDLTIAKECVHRIWDILIHADNADRLGTCGACEAVVSAFTMHMSDKDVAYRGCGAIEDLSYNNSDNTARLGACGSCEAVVSAVTMHMNDKDVAYRGCGAIGNLSYNNSDNTARLGACGSCEAVVSAVTMHMSDKDVARRGCWAIENLSCNPSNKAKLESLNVVEVLESVMRAHTSGDTNTNDIARRTLNKFKSYDKQCSIV
jgi:hypothetical protein